jgi:hypothetical protein
MNNISLLNLDRFDGYPDNGDKKSRLLTVLEKWQELGYDPADADQVNTPASRDDFTAPLLLSPPAGDTDMAPS